MVDWSQSDKRDIVIISVNVYGSNNGIERFSSFYISKSL